MTTMQKTIKYAALSFAILLCVTIAAGIIHAFDGAAYLISGFKTDIKGEMKEYAVSGEITSLDIDIGAADLSIKTGEAFGVKSDHKYIKVKENDGQLIIHAEKRHFSFNAADVKIEVTIPENYTFARVDIKAGAGKVTVDNLRTHNIHMELGAGDAKFINLISDEKTKINGGVGNLTVENGKLCNLDMEMGVGDVNLYSRIEGKSSIEFGIGDADINLIGTSDDYKLILDKGIGSVYIDGENIKNDDEYGSGDNKIDMEGGIGSIKVNFKSN